MYYCDNCLLLTDTDTCPNCGKKHLKNPEENDFCFLAEKPIMWGGMLADVLTQHGIPYTYRAVLGAGLAVETGYAMERYRYYVPVSRLSEAKEIVEELFGETGSE